MPLLGYDKWERFADAIDRAKAAARAERAREARGDAITVRLAAARAVA